MYKRLFLLSLLFLSACSFHVQVMLPTPTAIAVDTSTQAPISLPAAISTLTNTPTILTATPLPLPTFTPAPPQNSGATPIQFAPNGTYIDVPDNIAAGKSKTYS